MAHAQEPTSARIFQDIDTGFSGSKASRPALDRLMSDAAQRKFDCVVVYTIDRFGRSVLHLNCKRLVNPFRGSF